MPDPEVRTVGPEELFSLICPLGWAAVSAWMEVERRDPRAMQHILGITEEMEVYWDELYASDPRGDWVQ